MIPWRAFWTNASPPKCRDHKAHRYNSASMFFGSGNRILPTFLAALLFAPGIASALSGMSWNGVLTDPAGTPVSHAVIMLHAASGTHDYSATTAAGGTFAISDIAAGTYEVSVTIADKEWKTATPIIIKDAATLTASLQLPDSGQELRVSNSSVAATAQASGGQRLTGTE